MVGAKHMSNHWQRGCSRSFTGWSLPQTIGHDVFVAVAELLTSCQSREAACILYFLLQTRQKSSTQFPSSPLGPLPGAQVL